MDKDAYYFPHFCNARHDRKIRRVRKELGLEGYGIFFMLLEVLREQTDYKYPIEDIDLLADEFGTSEQKVRAVISNYGLYDVDENERFFSSNLIMYLQPYLQNKEQKRISGIKGNLIKYNHLTRDELKQMSDEDILIYNNELKVRSHCDTTAIAIKGKESKVKEKKYNPANDLAFFNDKEFQEVWKDYIDVRTRKKASKSDRAIKAIITKLLSFSMGDKLKAIAIVSKSADSGWSDLYALKEDEAKAKAAATQDVFWQQCPDCGYQVKEINMADQCPVCGEYGIAFVQRRGKDYPEDVA